MTDRTVLHLGDAAPDAGTGLIIPIDMVDIAGASIREDGDALAIKLQTSTGDRVLLGMSPAMLDALAEVCGAVRADLNARHGIAATVSYKPVMTSTVGVQDVEGVAFVAMVVDRSLPSAAAYLMPPAAARSMAGQLKAAARQASSSRGEADDSEA